MFKVIVQEITEVNTTESVYEQLTTKGNSKDDGPTFGYVKKPITEKQTTNLFEQSLNDIDVSKLAVFLNS